MPNETTGEFWRVKNQAALKLPRPAESISVLERLGASPFPKSRFPFLGFLATVYDHVADHVGSQIAPETAVDADESPAT